MEPTYEKIDQNLVKQITVIPEQIIPETTQEVEINIDDLNSQMVGHQNSASALRAKADDEDAQAKAIQTQIDSILKSVPDVATPIEAVAEPVTVDPLPIIN